MASNGEGFASSYPEGFFASYHGQKPICGVMAVAMAASVSYDIAHATCKRAMHEVNPKRQRFGGITIEPQIDLALKHLAVKFDKTIYEPGHQPRFIDLIETLEPDTFYHVIVPKHIMTVINGKVIDQNRFHKPVSETIYARKRVRYIRKINGKGW